MENRGTIERKGKNLHEKVTDRTKHMDYVVQDAKVIADASEALRLTSTKEGAKEIQKAIRQAGNVTKKEYHRQKKDLEHKLSECSKADKELYQRTKDSEKNAVALTSASGNIKETSAARRKIDQGVVASLKDAKFTDGQRKRIVDTRRRAEQILQAQRYQLQNTLFLLSDNRGPHLSGETKHEINNAIKEIKNEALEGKIVSGRDSNKPSKFSKRAKQEIEKLKAEIEKERMRPPKPSQPKKPHPADSQQYHDTYKKPLDERYKKYGS